jgi:hypothetical protein
MNGPRDIGSPSDRLRLGGAPARRGDRHHRPENRTVNAIASNQASEHVTLVEVLELRRPVEEFAAAARALVRRLEAEGITALVTMQFYADPGSSEVGALLTFADRSRFMDHVEMIASWEEFECGCTAGWARKEKPGCGR